MFNGLHKFSFNGYGLDLAVVLQNSNAAGRIRATLTFGGGDLGSYLKSSDVVTNRFGTGTQFDAVAFGTLGADTAVPAGSGFSDDESEHDFDSPTEGFASIPEAIEDIRNGKVVTFSLFLGSVFFCFVLGRFIM